MVTVNVYTVILTDHNDVILEESRIEMFHLPSSTGHKDTLNDLMNIKILCYGLHSHLYGKF